MAVPGPREGDPRAGSGNFKSNNGHALRDALLAGLGIAVTPDWLAHDGLRNGTVVVVLPEFAPTPNDINAVFPPNRMVSAKVRAFVDFLQEAFRKIRALHAACCVVGLRRHLRRREVELHARAARVVAE